MFDNLSAVVDIVYPYSGDRSPNQQLQKTLPIHTPTKLPRAKYRPTSKNLQ